MSTKTMNVEDLRWSHDKIYDHFSDKRSVYELVVQLLLSEVNVEDIPPLDVVDIDSNMFSLSNRRLFAIRTYKRILSRFWPQWSVFVPVRISETASGKAFTTGNQGTSVELTRPTRIDFPKHAKGPRSLSLQHRHSLSPSRRTCTSKHAADMSVNPANGHGSLHDEFGTEVWASPSWAAAESSTLTFRQALHQPWPTALAQHARTLRSMEQHSDDEEPQSFFFFPRA